MKISLTGTLKAVAFAVPMAVLPLAAIAETHRVAFQVNDNDPQRMNLVLNNVNNVIAAYQAMGDEVEVQIVAYGPGLTMLLAEGSPVADRISTMSLEHENITFQACGNTLQNMVRAAGHDIALLPEANIVQAGVVQLVTLQEQGWSYIRP